MVQSKFDSMTAVLRCVILINRQRIRGRTGFSLSKESQMRILVTGAQGCIGAWVVKNLLDRGLEVLIYDADPTPARLSLIAPATQVRKAAVETGRIEDGPRLKFLVKDGG